MKRILWVLIIVIIVAAVAARVATRGSGPAARSIAEIHESDGVPVDVATVRTGSVTAVREIVGEVTGVRQSTMRSNGAQKIARVRVAEGARVTRGQVLMEYDVVVSPDRVARMKQTREAYENAKRQVDRLRPLFEKGAVSESDIDNAETQLAIAAANMRDSRLEIEVVSPINGRATLVAVRPGDSVDDGEVLVQVARLDSVRVVADVSAAAASAIEPGHAVHLGGGMPATESAPAARGSIARVSLGANPDKRLFRIEAVLDNGDGRLLPGSVVRLAVITGEASGVPVIPAAAVQDDAGGAGGSVPVYVVRDGIARRVDAGVGLQGDEFLEVTTGVNVGDRVVVFGANLLRDGTAVRLHRVDGELVDGADAAPGKAGD